MKLDGFFLLLEGKGNSMTSHAKQLMAEQKNNTYGTICEVFHSAI